MVLHLMRKRIDTDALPLVFEAEATEDALARDWTIHDCEWTVESGWFVGSNRENHPGMIVSREEFFGDILLEFDARTLPPCTHDIDFMWNGSWNAARGERGVAYVGGLQGWWNGKVGIEKSPDYLLNVGTPLFQLEPGRTYHVVAGSAQGHCFVAVDGNLLIEATDPNPIDSSTHGKIGFEAYCSHIAIKGIRVKTLVWQPEIGHYNPEF